MKYLQYCEDYFHSENPNVVKQAWVAIQELNIKLGKDKNNIELLNAYALCGGLTKFTDPRPATNSVNIESDNYLKKQYDSNN